MTIRVMSERCAECLFTKGRIVSPKRMAEVVAQCRENGSHFICHKATMEDNQNVWCHGWWELEYDEIAALLQEHGLVEFVTEQDVKDAPAHQRRYHLADDEDDDEDLANISR